MGDNKLDDEPKVKVEGQEKVDDTKGADYKPEVKLDKVDDGGATPPATPPKKEETPPATPPVVANELKEEDVLKYLNTKRGTEFKNLEEFAIEKIVEKNIDYASEQLATIDKYVRETGRTAEDWFDTQSVDYTKMTSEQLVKEDLKAQFPNANSTQLEAYYKNKYHLDSEEYEDDEIAIAQMELDGKSADILAKAQSIQAKYRKPIEKKPIEKVDTKAPEGPSEAEKIRQAQKDVWIEETKSEINALEKLNIGKYEVALDEDLKNTLIEANSDLENFFINTFVKDGVWDKGRLNTFILLSQEGMLDKAIGNIESNLVAQGMDSVIENRKNLTLSTKTKETSQFTPEQQAQQDAMRDAIKEGFGL